MANSSVLGVWVKSGARALRIRSDGQYTAMFGEFSDKQKDIILQKESEFVAC
jgi:hypothetical protein